MNAEIFLEACESGDLQKVEELFEQNLLNCQHKDGYTGLMCAASKGNVAIVNFLIKQGAMLEIKSNRGVTALMIAAMNGHIETAEILCGSSIDIQDNDGFTALMWASYFGKVDSVNLLIKNGASIDLKNKDNKSTYEIAVLENKIHPFSLLVETSSFMGIKLN